MNTIRIFTMVANAPYCKTNFKYLHYCPIITSVIRDISIYIEIGPMK